MRLARWLVVVSLALPAAARQYWVSPGGSAGGDGSRARPWDLATALSAGRLRPGDTAWLLGGIYGGGRAIESRAAGSARSPVIVRQAPGARATIDGGLAIRAPYAWYWGFEIRNSGRGPGCVNTYDGSTGVRLINLVLHGCSQGIGFWEGAENGEAYGNLIYRNGYQGETRGHGHGIYTQNRRGTKRIADNIVFEQFGMGIHAYGSSKARVEGYVVEGNIVFDNGAPSRNGNVDNILFAVGAPMSRIRIEDNYTYHPPGANRGYSRIGWAFGDAPNRDVVVRRNYWIGGQSAVELWNWTSVRFSGNTCYSEGALEVILALLPGQSTRGYGWDGNNYYGAGKFRFGGRNRGWTEWRRGTGLDARSRFVPGRPSGAWIFVRPNRYERGRAHIAIYNWNRARAVKVDPGAVLRPGAAYEVRDARDYFGAPVVKGLYRGGAIAVPCGEFGAFVLIAK